MFFLFIHLATAMSLENLFFNEDLDLNLEISADSDLFSIFKDSDLFPEDSDLFLEDSDLFSEDSDLFLEDSDLFPEDDNTSDFFLADTDLCLSDNINVFLPTSKIRIRDACPSTSSGPDLTTLPIDVGPPPLRVNERKRLNKLFGVDSSGKLKDSDGNDLCPVETTFASTIPVCDSGSWDDAFHEAGGDYTLFHIRPCSFHPFTHSFIINLLRRPSCDPKTKIVIEAMLTKILSQISL